MNVLFDGYQPFALESYERVDVAAFISISNGLSSDFGVDGGKNVTLPDRTSEMASFLASSKASIIVFVDEYALD